jgi:hypothetical protein
MPGPPRVRSVVPDSETPSNLGDPTMARYIVERHFADGLHIPTTAEGAKATLGVVDTNAGEGVTWVHSYVSDDKRKTYCIYDGPDPDAVQRAATSNGLPVDSIAPVSVLDPYFYH